MNFKSTKAYTKLKEKERVNVVLSEDEISLKNGLEEPIRKFFQFYDDFILTLERENR